LPFFADQAEIQKQVRQISPVPGLIPVRGQIFQERFHEGIEQEALKNR
jgi:hypothetical protein